MLTCYLKLHSQDHWQKLLDMVMVISILLGKVTKFPLAILHEILTFVPILGPSNSRPKATFPLTPLPKPQSTLFCLHFLHESRYFNEIFFIYLWVIVRSKIRKQKRYSSFKYVLKLSFKFILAVQ